MPDPLEQVVQRMLDAGEPEDNIALVIKEYGSIAPVASHGTDTAESDGSALDTAAGFLPTAGGLVGSLVGGIPGAAIGGAAGEGFKQLAIKAGEIPGALMDVGRNLFEQPGATMRGAVEGMGEGLKGAGTQAVVQAGAEVGGRVMGAGLRTGGKRLYQGMLKPSVAARREYPNLIQTGLDHAIPISKGGAEKASRLAEGSRDAADALVADRQAFLQRLGPQAATIDPKQAVGGIAKAVQDVKELPVARPQMEAIGEYGRQYLKEHQRPLSLTQAQSGVRATDKFYNSAYRSTMDRGNPVTAGNTAAALGINNETRNLLRARVPGLQTQNAKTSALHGIQEAVDARTSQQGNLSPVGMQHLINAGIGSGVGAVGGTDKGIGTFALMEALTNPAIASRLAIGLAKSGSGNVTPQAIRQALLGLMASHAVEGDE